MSAPSSTTTQSTDAPRASQRRRLGEMLVEAGVMTEEQLKHALAERRVEGGRRERLGMTIQRLGYVTAEDIARALAQQLGLEYAESEELKVDPAATSAISSGMAERHGVLPLRWEDDRILVLACDDPTDVIAADDVRVAAGARGLHLVVVTADTIEEARRRAYGFDGRASDLLDAIEEEADEPPPAELEAIAEDAPIVRLAEGLLRDGLEAGASDIHVEPGSQGTEVRYRVDGVLHHVTTVPRSGTPALLSRLKIMAGMDIAERRLPQDGRTRLRSGGGEVDLRVSTLPSMYGETMVLRLLRKGDEQLTIDDVGFDEHQLTVSMAAIERPQGLVLLTGPTGSGKTSTLYAFLQELAQETRNIITLEDPVEYQLDGINQTQINERIGLTFPRSLRTVLRQDPDVVMVGEIRDPDTAELALQASLTGHLVLSTLHTNDAPGAVVRLRDLGIPSYLVSSALTMVVAQRLVRSLCRRCAAPQEPSEQEAAQLHLGEEAPGGWKGPVGCSTCGHTGYRGRTGLYEVLLVDGALKELVSVGGAESAIRQAGRSSGMRSLREHGLAKARAGVTSLSEVLRVTPADVVDEGTCPTCAQIVEPEFAHCPWCAADLRPPACAACEQELRFGWRACPSCGTLREEA